MNQRVGLAVANLLTGEILIRLVDPSGAWSGIQEYGVTTTPSSLTVGDVNHDGRLDLAVLDADGVTVRVLLDNGDGTFRLTR
ncbi:MAG: FG-GAP repeat protein [Acidobacteria bacterium]|nr:FG-GAP repeat protein [Acidobacteriota bacterium]